METKLRKQHFKQTFSRKVPENYERFFVPAIGRPLAEDLIHLAALQPGERVLDIACGTGIVARLASEKVGSTGSVTGLDVNPGMLEIARSIDLSGRQIEWFEGSAEEMPLPGEMFDVALCQLGLQFMEDKMAALREVQRVLVPGGRIYLNMPGPAAGIFNTLAEAMEHHVNTEAAGFIYQVFSLHNMAELHQLLTGAGFRNVSIEEKYKTFYLPAPGDFLWQYVYSTPLAPLFSEVSDATKKAFEHEVVKEWQHFSKNGKITYDQRILEISGGKQGLT